jgi:hypothetical protein
MMDRNNVEQSCLILCQTTQIQFPWKDCGKQYNIRISVGGIPAEIQIAFISK